MKAKAAVSHYGLEGLEAAMGVMQAAFDPAYGEAWNHAQAAGVLAMPGTKLLLATADKVVGFALMRVILDEAELMLLAVIPECRGMGIGHQLLEAILRSAATDGAHACFLEVRSDNAAVAFYTMHGFIGVGRRRAYYRGSNGITRDALTLRKVLS